MRASRGLKWENKMYKLKRSIPLVIVKIRYFKIINNHLIINFVFCLFVCLFVFSGDKVYTVLLHITDALVAAEAELNELDNRVGDGDCGSTLARGAKGLI